APGATAAPEEAREALGGVALGPAAAEAKAQAQAQAQAPGAGGEEPGPIRLVPEFLARHPIRRDLAESLQSLPVVCCKLAHLKRTADLRRSVFRLAEIGSVFSAGSDLVRPFRLPCYGEAHRYSLAAEAGLVDRLCNEGVRLSDIQPKRLTGSSAASCSFSRQEAAWVYEAAVTSSGAGEPYDGSRLAWLGDAAIGFLLAVWLAQSLPNADLEQLQGAAGQLYSNRSLNAAALAPPLELHRFIRASPFACAGAAEAADAARSVLSGGATTPDVVPCKKGLADALEAVVGATVVLCGLRPAALLLGGLAGWLASSPLEG
ncbi:unnamed protein product, partial [Prorocentrum cordatum]